MSDRIRPDSVRDAFHALWYDSQCWKETAWFGVPIQKNPFDLLQYQEVIAEQRPEFVIECGALHGGATLYFAHLLDLVGRGRVISIDVRDGWHEAVRRHPRVERLVGDSTSAEVLEIVDRLVPSSSRAFVLLDSDHTEAHVLRELRAYQRFVQVGDYLVVEDTNINGHPVLGDFGPGPYEAVDAFLRETADFVVDDGRERKLHFTFAPHGWLRRVARTPASRPVADLAARSRSMADEIERLNAEIRRLHEAMQAMQSTRGWRALEWIRRLRAAIGGLGGRGGG